MRFVNIVPADSNWKDGKTQKLSAQGEVDSTTQVGFSRGEYVELRSEFSEAINANPKSIIVRLRTLARWSRAGLQNLYVSSRHKVSQQILKTAVKTKGNARRVS